MGAVHPTAASLAGARLYGILDTGYLADADFPTAARQLIEGGAGILQVRAKGAAPSRVRDLVLAAIPAVAAASREAGREVPLVLNDHVELAASIPGVGAHVGQDDLDPAEARRLLGPDRVLGLSTHSEAQAAGAIARADVLSYFAVGPVFATGTKPDYVPVGTSLVAHVAALRPPLPWFAIGGIHAGTIGAVRAAGAARVVVVSALLLAPDRAAAARQLLSGT